MAQIAIRYDRRSLYYLAALYLTAAVTWSSQLSIGPRLDVAVGSAEDGNGAGLGHVLELAVTAARPLEKPIIAYSEPNLLTHLVANQSRNDGPMSLS